MVNYGEAIKRPFQDLKKLGIGIVLSLIPIVNLIAFGYILENTKSAMKKKYDLTEWKNWGDLFVKGLLMVIIGLVFAIPALVVFIFTLGFAAVQSMAMGMSATAALMSLPALGIGFVIFLILALLASYVTPAAILNYINKNKFSAAFELSEIKKRAFRSGYFAAWLVGELYVGALAIVLMWIPWIGTAIASFLGAMSAYTMIAEAWASK